VALFLLTESDSARVGLNSTLTCVMQGCRACYACILLWIWLGDMRSHTYNYRWRRRKSFDQYFIREL